MKTFAEIVYILSGLCTIIFTIHFFVTNNKETMKTLLINPYFQTCASILILSLIFYYALLPLWSSINAKYALEKKTEAISAIDEINDKPIGLHPDSLDKTKQQPKSPQHSNTPKLQKKPTPNSQSVPQKSDTVKRDQYIFSAPVTQSAVGPGASVTIVNGEETFHPDKELLGKIKSATNSLATPIYLKYNGAQYRKNTQFCRELVKVLIEEGYKNVEIIEAGITMVGSPPRGVVFQKIGNEVIIYVDIY